MPHHVAQAAENYLKEKGIFLYLNCEFKGSETLQELNYEMKIDCTGSKYEGPRIYLKGELADCIDSKTGQITVNEHLQMTSRDKTK